MAAGKPPYQLNVGCGRNIQEGWINLDSAALPGVDLVCDLENVFSQPFYSNADYGYRADWNPEKLTLLVYRSLCAGLAPQEIISKSYVERNVVKEMICEMRAMKPMREPRRELQTRGKIEIIPVD